MSNSQNTTPASGNHLLTIDQAAAFLKEEFGMEKNEEQLRRLARNAKAPFFKLDDARTAPYYIEANDLRAWIWKKRNAARKQSAA